ncbi:tetratricopeptide repeat-containing sulfotransferase family protein [Alteromonas facilis]|uniref:tetratricopeptide repeat-containing sulfotransferase family protein n=1 Tax=Alteromonas facilis TaxID=2048004 RepID=UPI003B834114
MSQTVEIKQAIARGQFEDAIKKAEHALQNETNAQGVDELRYFLVVAKRLSGKYEQAIQCATTLLADNSEYARAYQELGYVYQALNDTPNAAINFYQATKRNPALLASWRALVGLYQQMGNTQAAQIAQQQVAHLSQLPSPILQARDLMYEGQLQLADQLCRRYLQTDKTHAEAMLLLAELGIKSKVYNEAEFLLETCLELHKEHLGAGLEYLKLLSKMGKFSQALGVANRLLESHPEHPAIETARASALVGVGRVEEAIPIYQHLFSQNQTAGTALLLGHALKALGQISDSVAQYKLAYSLRPEFGDAYWSLANTKTYQFSDDEMALMQRQLERRDIETDDRIHLHFALGKAFEDRAAYAESFEHYTCGNRLKQEQINYSPAIFEQQVEAQIETCTPALFKRFADAGDQHADPIFIVGLPRAGSTLLEQILASHSMVDGTMELHNILGLASRLQGRNNQYPKRLPDLSPEWLAKFGAQYISDTKVYRAGAAYFIDKMPNNFLHIGLIKLILPNAKVIDARRHAMACCFSGYKQLFGEGQEFTYGLDSIGRYYRAYEKLMDHWDEVLPGFVLRVQHEDVVNDLEVQVRRILEFCNLPFESGCVEFHKTKRLIKTPSSEQVRQPIYRSGIEQWKHYEEFLLPLQDVLNGRSNQG